MTLKRGASNIVTSGVAAVPKVNVF